MAKGRARHGAQRGADTAPIVVVQEIVRTRTKSERGGPLAAFSRMRGCVVVRGIGWRMAGSRVAS